MIILVTGKPGGGKTSWVVAQFMEGGEFHGRPLYQDGIPELTLPHELIDGDKWMDAPTGAVIVIDEAQRVFRPRASSAAVPPHVAELETHRHKGVDIVVITQHPNLLDQNVRRLVGRHVHFRQTALHRERCEWHDGAHDPDSSAELGRAVRHPTKLQKKVFGAYKSAEEHTKIKRPLPWQLFLLAGAVLLVAVLGYSGWQRISAKAQPKTPADSAQGQGAAQPTPHQAQQRVDASAPAVGTRPADYVPRIVTLPQTAPVYDAVRQVQEMPVLAGCIASATRCACYDQRGMVVQMPEYHCRDWLAAPKFDPYRSRQQEHVNNANFVPTKTESKLGIFATQSSTSTAPEPAVDLQRTPEVDMLSTPPRP